MPPAPDRKAKTTLLHDGWSFRQARPPVGFWRPQVKDPGWMAAQVPGNILSDLFCNGVIPDPLALKHELGCQWVGESDWTYQCRFMWAPSGHKTCLLRFACLDTLSTVWLNGAKIAASDNYFVPLEVEVTTVLEPGENCIEIRFQSPVGVGLERRTAYCHKHGIPTGLDYLDERAFVRMPGHFFAWDWGPRLVGCGIRGPVTLVEADAVLTDLDLQVSHLGAERFEVSASASGADARLTLEPGDGTVVEGSKPGRWILSGGLWWPNGYGPQTTQTVTAVTSDGQRISKTIGLRTVSLTRRPDDIGESFEFVVNGVSINARGANFVTEHPLVHQTSESLQGSLDACARLGMNMLRVWGGGGYGSDDFFQACTERGILVWQDFPFACMYYPDDPDWQAVIAREASSNLNRIRHHPCLALLCGNNENLTMWQGKWGASGPLPDRYLGENLYEATLPAVVKESCPEIPYIPSSPIGEDPDHLIPVGPERNVNMGRYGDSHFWDVWHGKGDWSHYTESDTRFSSEFGFASCCGPRALAQMSMGPDPQEAWETLLHHDKTGKPWTTFAGLVDLHYPPSTTIEEWMVHSLLNQRDALRFGIEHFRRLPGCSGTLIWQWNDVWPSQSWAVLDWAGDLKPAGHELKRLYAPTMVGSSFLPGDPMVRAFVVNDGPRQEVTVLASLLSLESGKQELVKRAPLPLERGDRADAIEIDVTPYDPRLQALVLSIEGQEGSARPVLLGQPKDVGTNPAPLRAERSGSLVTIHPQGCVADLCLWSPDAPVWHKDAARSGIVPLWGSGPFVLRIDGDPQRLVARSLAGRHLLDWA